MLIQAFETKRIIHRPLCIEDAQALFKLDSDPKVMRYLGNKPLTQISQVYTYLDSIMAQYEQNGIGRWAMIEKTSGELIGWSGIKLIKELTNGYTDFYDLGYRIRPGFWGKGFATESSLSWIKVADEILNINTLYASAHIENLASQNVLNKVGFSIIGTYNFMHHENLIPCYWMQRKM